MSWPDRYSLTRIYLTKHSLTKRFINWRTSVREVTTITKCQGQISIVHVCICIKDFYFLSWIFFFNLCHKKFRFQTFVLISCHLYVFGISYFHSFFHLPSTQKRQNFSALNEQGWKFLLSNQQDILSTSAAIEPMVMQVKDNSGQN